MLVPWSPYTYIYIHIMDISININPITRLLSSLALMLGSHVALNGAFFGDLLGVEKPKISRCGQMCDRVVFPLP